MMLSQTLELLRRDWSAETQAIIEGEYVFWIGSGISRQRFPDLKALLRKLLETLQAKCDLANATCPFQKALREICSIGGAPGTDLAIAVAMWPNLDELLRQMTGRYADILNVTIQDGTREIDIFWDILKLDQLYSDRAVLPDAEHEFLAMLALEGVAQEIVTTNWDALTEDAYEMRRNGGPRLKVIAHSEEVDAQGEIYICRLFKIHGCARKASVNRARYGPFIVATSTEIASWIGREITRVFREEIQSLLRQRPAIFIGLSAQDFNLQAAWAAALTPRMYVVGERSRVLFAASLNLLPPQRTLLRTVYGNSFSEHSQEIERRSLIPMYGKPLLGGLYLLTLLEKCKLILQRGSQDFLDMDIPEVLQELAAFESKVCLVFDANPDDDERWRIAARRISVAFTHFVGIYRRQILPTDATVYEPLSIDNLARMTSDPGLAGRNLHLALFTMAVVFRGERLGKWIVDVVNWVGAEGQFRLRIGGRALRVFVLAGSGRAIARLSESGIIDLVDAPDTVVIYPEQGAPPKRPWSPRPGKIKGPTEIWFRDLLDLDLGIDTIVEMFRLELMAAR